MLRAAAIAELQKAAGRAAGPCMMRDDTGGYACHESASPTAGCRPAVYRPAAGSAAKNAARAARIADAGDALTTMTMSLYIAMADKNAGITQRVSRPMIFITPLYGEYMFVF